MSTNPLPSGPGVTPTERYLNKLAKRSFLSLWSYPGVFRDQGVGACGLGKEIADLLVVFEDHVVIFSDKDIHFRGDIDLDVAWPRWYRKAIQKSAEQVWGAERWIREHPDRLFLDASCTRRFPLALPRTGTAKYHRIVVAHDSSGTRRKLIGGSGSLLIDPSVVAHQHMRKRADGGAPFVIGDIDPAQGYVYVLDDSSLDAVLTPLDTITDFIEYLEAKERFIRSGKLALAYGEEDLLAYYLKNVGDDGRHQFTAPAGRTKLLIEEGQYRHFWHRPEAVAKREADKVSILWDRIIEDFAGHALGGTLYHTSDPAIEAQERILRFLAREPRVRRRVLSSKILEKLAATPEDQLGARVFLPSTPGAPYYAFLCLALKAGADIEEYRERRAALTMAYCKVVKLKFPDARYIVGMATESGLRNGGRSNDLLLLDASEWGEEDEAEAREIQQETGFLLNPQMSRAREDEYPTERYFSGVRKIGRNEACPCGSGRKNKHCCKRQT